MSTTPSLSPMPVTETRPQQAFRLIARAKYGTAMVLSRRLDVSLATAWELLDGLLRANVIRPVQYATGVYESAVPDGQLDDAAAVLGRRGVWASVSRAEVAAADVEEAKKMVYDVLPGDMPNTVALAVAARAVADLIGAGWRPAT